MKTVMLVDTDAGVDDALALLLALRSPAVEAAGVTTVFGNVPIEQAVTNAGLILDAAGCNAPYFRGAAAPLSGHMTPTAPALIHGPDGLGGATAWLGLPRRSVEPEPAAQALVRLAREHAPAGALTLLALGPLTNVAQAVKLDADFPRHVARLFIMGGTKAGRGNASPAAEFNFLCDPEAAALVLAAGFKEVWLLPWETAAESAIRWDDWNTLTAAPTPWARFAGAVTVQLVAYMRGQRHLPGILLPDLLAAAAALPAAGVIKMSAEVWAEVDIGAGAGRGRLFIDESKPAAQANLHLITAVHVDVLIQILRGALGAL